MDQTYNYSYQGNMPPEAAKGAFLLAGEMFMGMMILVIIFYVIMAISLMRIAKRTNTENAWFAWIPILNLILMLQIAKRPLWWLIFFLVPIINIVGIVLQFVLWIDIAKALGKSALLGFFAGLIPIIFVPLLAFSGDDTQTTAA
jgi:hypothetical protein